MARAVLLASLCPAVVPLQGCLTPLVWEDFAFYQTVTAVRATPPALVGDVILGALWSLIFGEEGED